MTAPPAPPISAPSPVLMPGTTAPTTAPPAAPIAPPFKMSPASPAVAGEAISRAEPAVPKTAKIVRGIGSSSRLQEYKTQPQAESFLKLEGHVRRTKRKSGRAAHTGPALHTLKRR